MAVISDNDFKVLMLKDELARWNVLDDNKIRRETLAKIIVEEMSLNEAYLMVSRLRNARGETRPLFEPDFRTLRAIDPWNKEEISNA
nr:MAG TPA: hypothetical protein [Caudoviricetes sp.]